MGRGVGGARCLAVLAVAVVVAAVVGGFTIAPAAASRPPECLGAPPEICAPEVGLATPANSNDYPAVRSGEFVTVRFAGVNSKSGGVIGVEPGLSHANLNGGTLYAPCKGEATAVPNVEDPIRGGEPYKAACEKTTEPSYYRSGGFGGGLRKRAPIFANGITIGNTDTTQECGLVCTHQWANRLSRFDVEIYLKTKNPSTGKTVTDFSYVRPRFTVSAFPHHYAGGFLSADWGAITPLRAGQRGTARLEGVVFSSGTKRASAGRLRFSMFENDANGRTSTGQPLQAFSVFTTTGGVFSSGAVYAGNYKLRLQDLESNRCVLIKHLPLPSMHERVDIHLDRPAFGIARARTVAC